MIMDSPSIPPSRRCWLRDEQPGPIRRELTPGGDSLVDPNDLVVSLRAVCHHAGACH